MLHAVPSLERTVPAIPYGLLVIAARPEAGVTAWAVEEALPPGAVAVDISDGGGFDPYTGKVKWGPFTDAQQRDLAYRLVPTKNIDAFLIGRVSWDGQAPVEVTGEDAISLRGDGFSSWLVLNFGHEVLERPEADPDFDGDGDGTPLLAEYYYGLDPNAADQPAIHLSLDAQGQIYLTLTRRVAVSGVQASFLRSGDLQNWELFDPDPPYQILSQGELETVVFSLGESLQAVYIKLDLSR